MTPTQLYDAFLACIASGRGTQLVSLAETLTHVAARGSVPVTKDCSLCLSCGDRGHNEVSAHGPKKNVI